MECITNFYKNLFGHPKETQISLRGVEMKKICSQDREELLAPFSLDEIHKVVFGMKKIKVLDLMDFLWISIKIFGIWSNGR